MVAAKLFAQWRGRSVVLGDPIALQLAGALNPSAGQPYTPVGDTDVPLLYGQSYDLRVRLMDLSRGGPEVTDNAINPGPAPISTIPFRRFVPFKPVTVTNLDKGATPASPQTMYEIARPLLNYPAAVFAGIPNAVAALLADLPAATAAGREAALPDPDAVQLAIDVQVRQLTTDAGIFVAPPTTPPTHYYIRRHVISLPIRPNPCSSMCPSRMFLTSPLSRRSPRVALSFCRARGTSASFFVLPPSLIPSCSIGARRTPRWGKRSSC